MLHSTSSITVRSSRIVTLDYMYHIANPFYFIAPIQYIFDVGLEFIESDDTASSQAVFKASLSCWR